MAKSKTGCCPPFDAKDWDNKIFNFESKKFVKVSTRSIWHIPIDINRVMKDALHKIERSGALAGSEYLMLSEEVSSWRSNHYIAVSFDVAGMNNTTITGKFLTKVFEGNYKDMPLWYKQLKNFAKIKGLKPVKTYFSYAMCPKCARKTHHNYVVGFEQITR